MVLAGTDRVDVSRVATTSKQTSGNLRKPFVSRSGTLRSVGKINDPRSTVDKKTKTTGQPIENPDQAQQSKVQDEVQDENASCAVKSNRTGLDDRKPTYEKIAVAIDTLVNVHGIGYSAMDVPSIPRMLQQLPRHEVFQSNEVMNLSIHAQQRYVPSFPVSLFKSSLNFYVRSETEAQSEDGYDVDPKISSTRPSSKMLKW